LKKREKLREKEAKAAEKAAKAPPKKETAKKKRMRRNSILQSTLRIEDSRSRTLETLVKIPILTSMLPLRTCTLSKNSEKNTTMINWVMVSTMKRLL
jgi:hypothetical protein